MVEKRIAGASQRPGASPTAYASRHKSAPGKTGRRARLAITLAKLRAKR